MARTRSTLLIVVAILIAAVIVMLSSTSPDDGTSTGSSSTSSVRSGSSATQSQVSATKERSCTDAKDDDKDSLIDCDDPDCASNGACRCSALSCGDAAVAGSTRTCLPENGCICGGGECMACKGAKQVCGSNADCCQDLGLTCQASIEGGTQVKRCAPTGARVCDITCLNGAWDAPKNCMTANVPPDTEDCEDLVGACQVNPGRNTVKCRES